MPLDADSNQKALLESESQTLRRRCGREVLEAQVVQISGKPRQIKSGSGVRRKF